MWHSTRRIGLAIAVLGLAVGAAGQARAGLIAHAPVNGLDTFEDTSTGLVWLKLPDLFNMSYAAQTAVATANGFTVADFKTLNQLGTGSAALGNGTTDWDAVAAVIGSSSSRQLMWGNYADSLGAGSPNAWYYAYRGDTFWSHYNPSNAGPFSDLGLWAYQSGAAPVPEPSALILAGLGGVSLIGYRWRRARKALRA